MAIEVPSFLQKWNSLNFLAYFFVVFLFVIHILLLFYYPYLNQDAASSLTGGQMFFNGARLYVNLIDTNPPMFIYLTWIPACISKVTHVPLAVCGNLFFFSLMILSMMVFSSALKCNRITLSRSKTLFWMLWLWLSIWTYQSGDFGQRDQLIYLFLSPFILIRHARYAYKLVPLRLAIIGSLFVSMALCMKPYYLLPVMAVEILFFLRYKHFCDAIFSTEIFIVLSFGVFYLCHFLIIPGMSSYYTYWLGFIIKGYSVYNLSLYNMILDFFYQKYLHVLLAGLFVLCTWPHFRKQVDDVLAWAFGWFAFFSLIVYFIQHKGWSYHRLPFYYSLMTGTVFLLNGLLSKKIKNSSQSKWAIGLIGVFFVFSSHPQLVPVLYRTFHEKPLHYPENHYVEVIDALTNPDDRVLFVNTDVVPVFPGLTYSGRMHGGRFLCTYPLAFIFHNSKDYEVPAEWKKDESLFYKMLVEDVSTFKPKLIIIQDAGGQQALPPYFRISQYLRRRGFYGVALSGYRFIGNLWIFEVHLRETSEVSSDKTISTQEKETLSVILSSLYAKKILDPRKNLDKQE